MYKYWWNKPFTNLFLNSWDIQVKIWVKLDPFPKWWMKIKNYLKPPLRLLKNTRNDHITYQAFHGRLGKSFDSRCSFPERITQHHGPHATISFLNMTWVILTLASNKKLENLHVACGDCSFESPATLSGSILPIFTSLKRYHINNDSTALTAKNSNWWTKLEMLKMTLPETSWP